MGQDNKVELNGEQTLFEKYRANAASLVREQIRSEKVCGVYAHTIRTLAATTDEPAVFPFSETNSLAAEQYKMVRTKLLSHLPAPAIILVSSMAVGDGKTVTALNIAAAFALKTDRKVLLVDCDLVRGAVSDKLGFPLTPGLVDVLLGTASLGEALIRFAHQPNFYVLPAGLAGNKHSELLDSPRWNDLCELFRSEFPYTILDSPPVGAIADYELLEPACDGIVLVVRPDHTDRTLCFTGLDSVMRKKLSGVIFNAADASSLTTNFKHYYKHYYQGESPAK